MTITKHIEIAWEINTIPGYGFGNDKKLYNLKTGREIKQCMNCQSVGYWFGKSFVTCTKLKTLLCRPVKEKLPF